MLTAIQALQVGMGGRQVNYMTMCWKLIQVSPQRIQRRMNVMQMAPRRMIVLFIWDGEDGPVHEEPPHGLSIQSRYI